MKSEFTYQRFLEYYTLTYDDVYDHIIERHFANHTIKQKLVARQNIQSIFEATFQLSNEIGFSKLTVRDLQKVTGLSMGSLYKCFDTKSDLEGMLIDGLYFITHHSMAFMEEQLKTDSPNFELAVKGHLFVSERYQQLYRLIFREVTSFLPENLLRVRELQKNYIKLLSMFMNEKDVLASDISLMIQDYYLRGWKYEQISIDQYADHCLKMAQFMKERSQHFDDLVLNFA